MALPDESVLSDLLAFLETSPTPYHAVAATASRLKGAGFREVSTTESWDDMPAGLYFTTRGESALVAWAWPAQPTGGFRIVGAHTDSPNLRLKPKPDVTKEGYFQLGVEVYGGVLLNSWLDRDLALAGRVFHRDDQGGIRSTLVRLAKPLVRVPQLAIHLDRDVTEKGLVLNKQNHMAPILGLQASGASDLRALCAQEVGLRYDDVLSLDLMLYDTVGPTLGGLRDEFLFSARLDNLAMCHAGLVALLTASTLGCPDNLVPVLALFDHEEVGSESATGAASALLPQVLERIVSRQNSRRATYLEALARSICVSADMAHAIHPNYSDRHEPQHKPVPNGGPVIKTNAQQRYATSATTAALFSDLCRQADVPVQHYAHRTDLPCGSTIGPIVSTQLGIRTVDVGNPMLSMHSIREMGGTKDPDYMVRAMKQFFVARDPFQGR
jgi:aspartyl aminopeptidase